MFTDQARQQIKKQRQYFADKGPCSQSYGFSNTHAWMWKLDYKESWAPKSWCFWTVLLERTLESPLYWKELQPVHPRGHQSWIFIGRKLKLQYFGHLMWKTYSFEKTLMQGKIEGGRRKGHREWVVGWHHWLDGHEFE